MSALTPYEELFLLIDTDGGGTLSLDEVQAFCEKLNLPSPPSPQVIARLFVQADADRSDAIDKDEFTALCEGIKLVVGLTEKQMVEAYASHEIRRLFSYLCTNNGQTMRKDELRKAVDVLNHALHLDHPDTVINTMLRDLVEVDFDEFKALVTRLCPDKSLTTVANVFLLEERRRREHLIKVKSMYERNRSKPSQNSAGRTPDPEAAEKKCPVCPLKDQHIETLSQQIAGILEEKRALESRVREIHDAAMREVQFTQTIQKLQAQMTEEADRHASLRSLNDALKKTIAELHEKVQKLEDDLLNSGNIVAERDALAADFALLEKEHATTQQEVQTLQERLARKAGEVTEQQQVAERLRQKLQEREERIDDLERRESEVHVKEIESLRMQRLMADMKERCEKRERELDEQERELAEGRFKVLEREQALEHREDVVTAMERQVRRYELECQEKWETVFRKAQEDSDILHEKMNIREMEIVNKEAELAVREQIFDANQRKAEATSLPERERRLKILQSIEQQLSIRERNLRIPERQMVHSMVQPELITLREENQHLQSQVVRLRVELDAQQQRLKEEVDKSRAERQSWIEKSKLRVDVIGSSAAATGNSFASARSRRQSIIGGSPPQLGSSP